MSATLFSRDWYRIASLQPALHKHVSIHPHRYRQRRWYLLEDHMSGKVRRLSASAYVIVGLMDGSRTVDQLWEISAQRLGEEMPTHEEMLQLISSLYQSNLIRMENSGDISELFERDQQAREQKILAKFKSPLSIQIPLIDPNAFLERTAHLVRGFYTPVFAVIFLLMMVSLVVLTALNFTGLTENVSDRVLGADNLLLLWGVYPLIKLLHELGHAYTVKRFGGAVHEMGVMLLVLLPMPYVDASACASFSDKKQRMLVGAAGMMVELFIATFAMWVWVGSEPGLVKSIAFNIIFIAGVSTLLVNGNPLLRFDGYYVLADFLELPNLAQRANQYWGWLAKRVLFGVKGVSSPAYDKGEAMWLCLYGVAALVYRLILMVTIFLFVAQQYFFIGVILATWSVFGTWLWPNAKKLGQLLNGGGNIGGSRSPKWVVPLCIGIVVLVLGVIKFPLTTSVEGVVQLSQERRIVSSENCFVNSLTQGLHSVVKKGDVLLRCSNDQLLTEHRITALQLAAAKAQRQGVYDDAVELSLFDEEIRRLEEELYDKRQRLSALTITAHADGVFVLQQGVDIQGHFIRRGELIGYILDNHALHIQAMINEETLPLIAQHTEHLTLMRASDLTQAYRLDQWSIQPQATHQLPSPVLAQNSGGQVVMDPTADQPQALERYFLVDIQLQHLPEIRVQERMFVRFEHAPEALVYRVYRVVRRTFLAYFDV